MSRLSLPLLLGMGFSFALTPISRRLALRIGAIDKPGERRIHAVATPRFGGPAILIALVLALLLASLLDPGTGAMLRSEWQRFGLLGIGALIVTLVGAVDDIHPLSPITKLLVELAAASIATYGGYRIDSIGFVHVGLWSLPLSVFFIVAAVNAVNLVDGLDGLAVGLCLIIGSTLLLMSLSAGRFGAPMLLAALCGVLLGFLPYNFRPARIFLGDSGALLLGFMVGVGAISVSQQMTRPAAAMAPFLALGLPLAELTLTTARRILYVVRVVGPEGEAGPYRFTLVGRPALFSADRDHIHHRLLTRGLSHRGAVLLLYGASATISAAALMMATREGTACAPILAAILVGSVVGVRYLGYRELMPLHRGWLLPLFESRAMSRKSFHVTLDAIAIVSSCALALLIEEEAGSAARKVLLFSLPAIAIAQIAGFAAGGLYRRSWRRAGIDDVLAATKALALAVAAEAMVAMLVPSLVIGLRVVIMDAYLLATMVLGARLSFQVLEHLFHRERAEPAMSRYAAREVVRLDADPRAPESDRAPEPAAPRRSAIVVPIRSASVPR